MNEPVQYLKDVREQYERYPYPPRDPAHDKVKLLAKFEDYLDVVRHYCFGGKRKIDESFRVLVAGGGTGDSTLFLAEQLRDTGAKVWHLDMSHASIDCAKKRADVRGVDNVEWVHASILDLPKLSLGEFDYINCLGVLHHMAEPEKGLQSLVPSLKEEGAMALMVYGRIGRTGIYQMQDLLKLGLQEEKDMASKVDLTKELLERIPPSNWFKRGEDLATDHLVDAGIYDLFLHSHDRAYTVPEVYRFLESAGLTCHTFYSGPGRGTLLYQPETYLKGTQLEKRVALRTREEKEAIAELISGSLVTHSCYVTRGKGQTANSRDLDMVPFSLLEEFEGLHRLVEGSERYFNITLPMTPKKLVMRVEISELAACILRQVDGERPLRLILARAKVEYPGETPTLDSMLTAFEEFYKPLNDAGLLYLRHKDQERTPVLSKLQTGLK